MINKKQGQLQSIGISPIAIVSFLVSVALCSFIISAAIINKTKVERMSMEQQLYEKNQQISESTPIKAWYSYPQNIAFIFAGIIISLTVFFIMQKNYELKKIQVIFEQMATTDTLTGISNRRHFLEMVRINIEKSRRYNENCYLILFDIDKFKNVNDTYGHTIGDKVLIEVAARIKHDIRPYDLFSRYGGEEFMIFISGVSDKDIFSITERLRLSLCNRKYEYDGISISSSSSFGIAQIEEYNLDRAIEHSDEALYEAKRNGRNCTVFYSKK